MTSALVNASIQNNMTSAKQIAYWQGTGTFSKINGSTNATDIKTYLNNVLSNTTIKRACCLGGPNKNNFTVNVRIPIPANYDTSDLPAINQSLGFIDKTVTVPSTLCNNLMIKDGTLATYAKNSPTNPTYNTACDDFYAVYCANMRAQYNDEFSTVYPGQTVDMNQFVQYYKPECSCYAWDVPPAARMYSPMGLGYTNCTSTDNDAGNVYLDPASRDPTKKPSELVICSQLINLAGAQAGGDIHIDASLTQNCGNNPTMTPTITSTPSTPTSTTTTKPTSTSTSTPTSTTTTKPTSTSTPSSTPTGTTLNTNILLGIPVYIWIIVIIIIILLLLASSGYVYVSRKR